MLLSILHSQNTFALMQWNGGYTAQEQVYAGTRRYWLPYGA